MYFYPTRAVETDKQYKVSVTLDYESPGCGKGGTR
jgi:hypothetical protein